MAGLLDFISGGENGGGLLDYLRSLQPQGLALSPDMQPANFNANQGFSQASPLQAFAQSPVPLNPPPVIQSQPIPQPAPQQTQQAPASSGPGIGDRLGASLQSFANSGGPLPAIANGLTSLFTGQRSDPTGVAQAQQAQMQNLTARALLSKNVDPTLVQAAVANPDLMQTLVKQTFGPRTIQSIGGGYIYHPDTQKIERAYEPDDKVPVGFEKTDKGLRPIAGGPADPAYLRLKETAGKDPNAVNVLGKGAELYKIGPDGQPVIVHKNQDGTDATLSDDATKAMAAQYLSGDKSVLQNLGRGAQGSANIVKLREEITKQAHDSGLSAKDILTTFNEQAGNLAGQRTVGTRAANISLAANEANNMIPIALEASAKVPRGDWMPWNKAVQAYQRGSSSPELASFVAATNSLVNAYVRAVSPSGVPTDSMREHAYSMLNSAQGPDAYAAVISTMRKEMQSALEAPAQVRKELRGESNSSENKSKVTVIDGYKIMEH